MRRRSVLAGILLLTAPLVTSCSVPADGIAGVTVDADGAVFGIIATCTHRIDGASLYRSSDPEREDESEREYQTWETIADTRRSLVRLPIVGGPGTTLPSIDTYADLPATELSFYGWTRDNSYAAAGVSFTSDDLAALAPGDILTGPWSDDDGVSRYRTYSTEEFPDRACEYAAP